TRQNQSVYIFQFAFLVLSIGLLYSRFMISLGMIFFLVGALWDGNLKVKFGRFLNNKYYLAVTGIFLIFLISGLWSENTDYFLNRMRIKLPFLFLPFAFFASPKIDKLIMKRLMFLFIGIMLSSAIWSTLMFLTDIEHFIEIYKKGQIIPTPIHHVRYSILISISVLFCIYLILNALKALIPKEKTLLLLVILFLTGYSHLLAVRSGLLTLYIVLACWLFFYIKMKGRPEIAVGLIIGAVIALLLASSYVPTIRNKIAYTRYSIELFKKNENIRELSDSRRLGSIIAGIELTKENPITGVGIGDLMDETNEFLKEHYPDLTDLELLPHNQYILTSTATGIPAMFLFILFTVLPLFYKKGYGDILIFAGQMLFFASFMVEHTIESQIGVAVYIFILLFSMKNRESTESSLP
ncbi:MAG: O-antigen ligase family protein, partial [Bacteroidia bacterium]|nr:O-antigen ligase family protein [Bacteroidia bacterium]